MPFSDVITLVILIMASLVTIGTMAFCCVMLVLRKDQQQSMMYVSLLSTVIGIWLGAASNLFRTLRPTGTTPAVFTIARE